ncbi:MAG: hypothetical protein EPO21_07720 [Chloroflexota bacterium]|nr:MAG: hypothetical protein EPO21_07720 [Chloroflexota bacterium]
MYSVSDSLELAQAVPIVLEGLRRRQRPVAIKIRGVRSSVTVRQAVIFALRERLRNYWTREDIDRYCDNLDVELHAAESDGNWYDIFAYSRDS